MKSSENYTLLSARLQLEERNYIHQVIDSCLDIP